MVFHLGPPDWARLQGQARERKDAINLPRARQPRRDAPTRRVMHRAYSRESLSARSLVARERSWTTPPWPESHVLAARPSIRRRCAVHPAFITRREVGNPLRTFTHSAFRCVTGTRLPNRLISNGFMLIWRKCPRTLRMDRRVLYAVRNGACAQTSMPNCHRLQRLKITAAAASLRCRSLLEESPRLTAVTGLSPATVLDLVCRSLETRKRACAALASHAELHGCASEACNWPAPDCHGCSLVPSRPVAAT